MNFLSKFIVLLFANIIEGHGRSVNKKEYERFLVFCHSSNQETIGHLEKIIRLYPEKINNFEDLKTVYDLLGGKINNYLKWVRENWNKGKENPEKNLQIIHNP